jgi:hypothetical protein
MRSVYERVRRQTQRSRLSATADGKPPSARKCFSYPTFHSYGCDASRSVPGGDNVNRFDREYWDGAREMALMFYESIKGRRDVPDDLKRLAETALRETGERRNRDFREAIGVATPPPRILASR